uniref:hypothetical protein n=1 Tax=Cellulomonas sp. RIT-PI-Y TaxID=3035297 RepID=UPI0021D87D04
WTLSLAIDRTEFQAGESVTIVATANQNVYDTQQTYKVYINDLTTGETIQTCYNNWGTSGSNYTCTAIKRYNTGSTHEYEAVVASYTDQETNIQATSNKV